MVSRSVVFLAAAASLASAQNCSSFVNATSQSDLDKLSGCSTFDAALTISGDAGVLTLNGVQNITGDLTIQGASDLSSFSAPSLEKVGGTLKLDQLTILSTLSMPQLTDLGGISLQTLPALEELQFNAGVQNARNILVSDTALKSLDGLNLSHVDNFNVNNNKRISDITIQATQISQLLDISYNSEDVNVSLPNLEWANNATFRYCASVSMPKISKVNQSLGFINNTMYGLSFDSLSSIGGTLTINSNSELRNASFQSLKSIGGGFVIANNTHFGKILGFPKLETVGGAIEFQGNLTSAALPKLDEVDGGVNVESNNFLNCSSFDKAHSNGDFHGDKYVCKGKSTTVSASLTSTSKKTSSGSGSASATGSSGNGAGAAAASGSASPTGSSSGKGSSSAKSKAKNGAAAPAAAVGSGLAGTVAALFFHLL